jgi:hypothetical protein
MKQDEVKVKLKYLTYLTLTSEQSKEIPLLLIQEG